MITRIIIPFIFASILVFSIMIIDPYISLGQVPVRTTTASISLDNRIDQLMNAHTQNIQEVVGMALDIIIEQQQKIVQLTTDKERLLDELEKCYTDQEKLYGQCQEWIEKQKNILNRIREFATVQVGMVYGNKDIHPMASVNFHISYFALEAGFRYGILSQEPFPYFGIFFRF